MHKMPRPYMAELIGTFLLVFFSAGILCVNARTATPALGLAGIAVAQGLVLAVALSATMNTSGGFLNPAVVVVLWVFKRLEGTATLALLGVQLLGAILAGMCLRLLFTEEVFHQATPHVNLEAFNATNYDLRLLFSGAGIELALTFLLTFAIFGTILDARAPRMAGLGVGLAMSICVLMGYPLTGAAANPARALGMFAWDFPAQNATFREHLFVYWIGAMVGALLAAVLYMYLILPVKDEHHRDMAAGAGSLPERTKK